jgi:hypothetical protein
MSEKTVKIVATKESLLLATSDDGSTNREVKPGEECTVSEAVAERFISLGVASKAGSAEAKAAGGDPLEELSVKDLKALAKSRGVEVAPKAKKDDLVAALRGTSPAGDDVEPAEPAEAPPAA